MKKLLSRNMHWLVLILVVTNMMIGFTNDTYSKPDIIAAIFGIVGLLGVIYLAFHIEAHKRRKKEEK